MTSRAVKTLRSSTLSSSTDSSGIRTVIAVIDLQNLLSTRWIPFAGSYRAVPRDAPRKNHTWGIRHVARPIRDVAYAMRRGSGAEGERIPGLRQEGLEKCSFSSAAPSAAINRQRRRVRGILKCYSRGDLPSLFRDRARLVWLGRIWF